MLVAVSLLTAGRDLPHFECLVAFFRYDDNSALIDAGLPPHTRQLPKHKTDQSHSPAHFSHEVIAAIGPVARGLSGLSDCNVRFVQNKCPCFNHLEFHPNKGTLALSSPREGRGAFIATGSPLEVEQWRHLARGKLARVGAAARSRSLDLGRDQNSMDWRTGSPRLCCPHPFPHILHHPSLHFGVNGP